MAKTEPKKAPPRRCYLYHEGCPKGRIFVGDEIDKQLKKGWAERPPPKPPAPDPVEEAEEVHSLRAELDDLAEANAELRKENGELRGKLKATQQSGGNGGKGAGGKGGAGK